jgi:hypothetical protein
MTDEMKNKVIHIFQRHQRGDHFHFEVDEGGELVISPDGFNYVSFKTLHAADPESGDSLMELAQKKHYIIKMLEHHRDSDRVNNYYVSGERLEEFLTTLHQRPGKILEIERFYPDNPA